MSLSLKLMFFLIPIEELAPRQCDEGIRNEVVTSEVSSTLQLVILPNNSRYSLIPTIIIFLVLASTVSSRLKGVLPPILPHTVFGCCTCPGACENRSH